MSFTAADARSINKNEASASTGQVIDLIRASAKRGETSILYNDLNLSKSQLQIFTDRGFLVSSETISWAE